MRWQDYTLTVAIPVVLTVAVAVTVAVAIVLTVAVVTILAVTVRKMVFRSRDRSRDRRKITAPP